jgi:hypothetical protein
VTELVSMLVPLQGTLPGWPVAEQPSALQVLGLLVGLPALVFVIIAILGKSKGLIRAGRGDSAPELNEPVWLGAAPSGRSELTADGTVSVPGEGRRAIASAEQGQTVGGASVRW